MSGGKTGSGITLGIILGAVSELRHRLRHGLIMLAAYGPGYGYPDPDEVSLPPTEAPAVLLDSDRPDVAMSHHDHAA